MAGAGLGPEPGRAGAWAGGRVGGRPSAQRELRESGASSSDAGVSRRPGSLSGAAKKVERKSQGEAEMSALAVNWPFA